MLQNNIIETVISVDKTSMMLSLMYRKQKSVNFTIEFLEPACTPKKVIVSEDLRCMLTVIDFS